MSRLNLKRLSSLFVLVFGLCCLSIGCSTTSSVENGQHSLAGGPEWLRSGQHPEYRSRYYVTGLGTGTSRKQAFASGLSEIVLQVKTNIDVRFESESSRRIQTNKGGGEKVSSSSDATQHIELKSTFEAKGLAELVDVYREPTNGTFHAFVAVSKSDAVDYFKNKYESVLSEAVEMGSDLDALQQSPDIRRIAELYNDVLESERRLAEYASMVRVFGGQIESDKKQTFDEIRKTAVQLQRSVREESAVEWCVTTEGDLSEGLEAHLLESRVRDWLAARGINAYGCDQSGPPDKRYNLLLRTSVTFRCDQTDEIESMTMCRSAGRVRLETNDARDVILQEAIGGEKNREAHRRVEQALRLTQKHLSGEVTALLADVFGQ
jgi:hypothetical protein